MHLFKDIFLQILDDAKDMTIEPPEEFGPKLGVCHWCCLYSDMDVARKMLQMKNVQINRFDKDKQTGPFLLIEKRGPVVIQMLELLHEKGLDVNARFDENSKTLLEGFITAISKNYEAIKKLIEYGADVNASYSKITLDNGQKMTLTEFVSERGDPKLKKIFNIDQ